jgi:ABC-type lipoprotein export system ATPase subunit
VHTLKISNIIKKFMQGEARISVLNGIDAEFVQGVSYAITGVSGSGKSTLLHILSGLEVADVGTIIIDGNTIDSLTIQQRTMLYASFFGVVFQQSYLIQELCVLENVMLKGLIDRRSYQECAGPAHAMLEAVGLADKAHALPMTLSGGQQQRVAVLRALFNKPAFLLADEPTGSLDKETGQKIIDFLLACQQTWGMGLIVCSHDPYVVERMQVVLHLEHGLLHKKDLRRFKGE